MDASLWPLLLQPLPLAVLGLCVGSFLNVVVYRLPLMLERRWWQDVALQLGDAGSHERLFGRAPAAALADVAGALQGELQRLPLLTLSRPRSHCPQCGTPIAWHDNLPVLGWLKRRGRCAACGEPIAVRYPLLELATGLLWAALGLRFQGQPQALLWCALASALLALALIDWDTQWLPDALTLPLAWAGLVAATAGWIPLPPHQSMWGAVAGYLSLWLLYWAFRLATGQGAGHPPWSAAHWAARAASGREGLGFGDFKLLAALGAWLGVWLIVPMLLWASLLGTVAALLRRRAALGADGRMPFGPFLASAGLAVLLVGPHRVLHWLLA
ncbi:prepilin peptidase [Azohydromonas lata]|uniref:prepilin peptidase n=1 Tax=Azohydromonas lata TaxID=45677 RepID=UPI00083252A1|nr:A24 family peptidase [Azohydromonas lata]